MVDKQENRVAIVTGVAGMRGIGRAIAIRFAKEGLNVALVDIERQPSQIPPEEKAAGWKGIESVRDEIVALGRRAIAIHADISNAGQVDAACERATAELGPIDVLVNSARAAIGRDRALVIELDPAEWDRVFAVNARGTFLLAQAVGKRLVQRGSPGHIINISSIAGKVTSPRHAAYSASKFAVNGLTQTLALELGPHGINVNAICPGVIDTGRVNLSEQIAAEKAGISLEEAAKRRFEEKANKLPLRRVGVADDIAGMAAFLISPDARHITGQAINVCGGETFH